MLAFSKIASKIIDSNNADLIKQANTLVKAFEEILGFDFTSNDTTTETKNDVANNEEKLLDLISTIRAKLRAEKNFALSDFIRDELSNLNINISDKKI